ncbi:N-acetylmuramoyl-L-alanine amidase family protein [Sinanaerobacter chloroacetimidivorans]|uniref:N-acetylmuramoyl-L-alanine amidase n=1 Tax=Sinanaerobacter chloroacetimidivorans TaxID=2818044 RepID=A0A8J8B0C8_9FIRM|nr:N-acetylmuramoyl-L-alanine amidase family protein [Sinanaerobacter chloroacetimidivorans]MBR0596692.1 N-acetylmuramoyl-L-alanine amidase [Sinanaerobacter chloroacetimidivorans]
MTKKINFTIAFLFIMVFCTIMGKTVAAAATPADVKLVINNEQVTADVMPFIQNDRTLVPARAVFEALGGTVNWDQSNYIVTIEYDGVIVILKINDTVATVNGRNKTLDVPATIKNGRTMIPVRFVAEELGFLVGWINSTRTVTITSSEKTDVRPVITGYVTEVSVEEGTSNKENTIVTVQMSEPLKAPEDYSTMNLTSPDRFVLDVKNFLVDSKVSGLTYDQKDSPLTAVRVSAYNENAVRIVCDLKEATTPTVSLSADGKTLTISFRTLSTYFNPMDDGKLVVMLDPGHGESTAGKRSPDGTLKEYEFNRTVANKMKNILEAQGIEVLLTVNDDSDPSLANRCESANNSDADIFVSIHANAFGNGKEWTTPKGWEIYHYQGSVLGNRLAAAISSSNFPEIGILNRGIKTGNLYVIKNTYIPAVLIEHGFFTNIEEVELLKSDEWRDKAAQYNAEGIMNFLNSYIE